MKLPTKVCEWHQVEVELDISYHGPSSAGFDYACGCRTDFSKNSSTLTTDEGQKLDLNKQGEWPVERPVATKTAW